MSIFKKRYNQFLSNVFIYIRIFVFLAVFIIFSSIFIFLYKYFYQTLIDASEVVFLQSEVAFKDIDIDKFNKIKSINQYKQISSIPEIIPNPFSPEMNLGEKPEDNE